MYNDTTKFYHDTKLLKMLELLNMTSFNEKGTESTLHPMHVLATDIDTVLQCKLLSMAPQSARTAAASTEYKSAELLAVALDAAMEKID